MSDPSEDPLYEKCAGLERKYAKEHEVRTADLPTLPSAPFSHTCHATYMNALPLQMHGVSDLGYHSLATQQADPP